MFTLLGDVQQQADLNSSFQIAEDVLKKLEDIEAIAIPERLIGSSVEEIVLFEQMKEVFQSHDIPMPTNPSMDNSPVPGSDSIPFGMIGLIE